MNFSKKMIAMLQMMFILISSVCMTPMFVAEAGDDEAENIFLNQTVTSNLAAVHSSLSVANVVNNITDGTNADRYASAQGNSVTLNIKLDKLYSIERIATYEIVTTNPDTAPIVEKTIKIEVGIAADGLWQTVLNTDMDQTNDAVNKYGNWHLGINSYEFGAVKGDDIKITITCKDGKTAQFMINEIQGFGVPISDAEENVFLGAEIATDAGSANAGLLGIGNAVNGAKKGEILVSGGAPDRYATAAGKASVAMTVKLGKYCTMNSVKIYEVLNYSPRSIKIEVGDSYGALWTTVVQKAMDAVPDAKNGYGNWDMYINEFAFAPAIGDMVRVTITVDDGTAQFLINELEGFGTPVTIDRINIAENREVTSNVSASDASFGADKLTDEDRETYYASIPVTDSAGQVLTLELGEVSRINTVGLIEKWIAGNGTAEADISIGYKADGSTEIWNEVISGQELNVGENADELIGSKFENLDVYGNVLKIKLTRDVPSEPVYKLVELYVLGESLTGVGAYLEKYADEHDSLKTYEDLINACEEAQSFISLLSAASDGDLADYMESNKAELPFAKLDSYDSFENVLDDDGKAEVLSALAASGNTQMSVWEDVFTEKTILASIDSLNNWRNVERILSGNESVLSAAGLNYKKYNALCNSDKNQAIDSKIAGESYDNLNDLAKAVNAAIATYEASLNKPSKPSGGSSGGGGSGSVTVIPTVPKVEIPVEAWKPSFKDMSDYEWALESVNYLAERGIVSGRDDDTFDPGALVTREEFIKMIVLAMNLEKGSESVLFADVDEADWYYTYVRDAFSHGIIKGLSDELFGVGETISREDMAVILCRVAEKLGVEMENGISEFTDGEYISDYAVESIGKLVIAGVIQGMGDGSFAPGSGANRAQSASMLYKMMMYMESK